MLYYNHIPPHQSQYKMSRTARRKLHYFSTVAIGTCLLVSAILYFKLSALEIAFLVIGLLIPGRILGFFWRDQFAGLRLLNERHFEESALHSKRFLDLLARRQWIRHGPVLIGPDAVFVLGDFRDNSLDSRRWGPIPIFNLHGRAQYIWFSLAGGDIRWDRIGTSLLP
jgi:hypothetical protein